MSGRIGVFLLFLVSLGFTEAIDYNILNNVTECNYQVVVPGGQPVVIKSAQYPNFSSERCKYTVTTYNNHRIGMECMMGMGGTTLYGTCSTDDGMYFQADGSGYFHTGTIQSCALNRPYAANTTFNSITFAFFPQKTPGTFSCVFRSYPAACDCGIGFTPRIVGGTHYTPNSVPSMAAIRDNNGATFGGSIISGNVILTAAHGLYKGGIWAKTTSIGALVGCDDLSKNPAFDTGFCQRYEIAGYAVHPSFDPESDLNDLALVFTKRIFAMNRAVFPICLPRPDEIYNKYENQALFLFGWGSTQFSGRTSDVLLGTQVYGFPLARCTAARPDINNNKNFVCTASQGRNDSCQGDSGGGVIYKDPQIRRDFLAATIMGGGVCGAGPTDPGINLRTAPYVAWMKQTTGPTNFFCTY